MCVCNAVTGQRSSVEAKRVIDTAGAGTATFRVADNHAALNVNHPVNGTLPTDDDRATCQLWIDGDCACRPCHGMPRPSCRIAQVLAAARVVLTDKGSEIGSHVPYIQVGYCRTEAETCRIGRELITSTCPRQVIPDVGIATTVRLRVGSTKLIRQIPVTRGACCAVNWVAHYRCCYHVESNGCRNHNQPRHFTYSVPWSTSHYFSLPLFDRVEHRSQPALYPTSTPVAVTAGCIACLLASHM